MQQAKKREPGTGKPWPKPAPLVCYVVVFHGREFYRGYNVEAMMDMARPRVTRPEHLKVMTARDWDADERQAKLSAELKRKEASRICEEDAKKRRRMERAKTSPPPPRRKKRKEFSFTPAPTFDVMRPTAAHYERIKAAYYAGVNLWWLNEETKAKFEAFRPRRTIGPMASECEAGTTTVKDGGKWRPLQSGMDIDRCLQTLEHEDDVNWDHQ